MSFLKWAVARRSFLFLMLGLTLSGCGGGGSSSGGGGGTGTTPTVPAAPTGLSATAGSTQVALTWTASTGATSYHVKRGTATGGPYTTVNSPTAASFTDTGLTNGTAYFYVVTAVNTAGESANSSQATATPTGGASASVNVTIDVMNNRHAISPFVYGGSFPKNAAAVTDSGMTAVRWGGNATSTYNWQLHTNNSANDFFYEDFNTNGFGDGIDGNSTQWVTDVRTAGGDPLMTMPMLPWAAKTTENNNGHWSFSVSKYGAQCTVDSFNTDAGNGLLLNSSCSSNPTPVTGNDPNDAYVPLLDQPGSSDPAGSVYRNQWAAALAAAFGTTVPHFYNMDNEVDIWSGTHRDVHPTAVGYEEWRDTYLLEARNLKTWDPDAIRLGPVSCCWFFYWNSANGNDKAAHGNVDLLSWWLNDVYWYDQIDGVRSLDIFDIHAYPESPDGLSSQTTAQKQASAIRAFRDWWDPTRVSEAQEVNQIFATSIQPQRTITFRIPRMKALMNTTYPGTKFAITEWATGFADTSNPTHFDFSTALSDAMGYGILGQQDVYLASRWTAQDPAAPGYLALKLYRNYDGAHGTFGDISIGTTNDGNPSTFATYSAVNSTNGNMTIMVVNGDPTNSAQVQFALSGYTATSFKSYTLANSSPTAINASASQAWSSTQTFAPYSITLLVISGTPTNPGTEWELNPAEIMAPAGGSITFSPQVLSGSGTITLTNAVFDAFAGAPACTGGSINLTTATLPGTITLNAGSTPGFCHFTVTGTDGTNAQTKGGWLVVGNPAATLTNSTASAIPAAGSQITLSVTLNPGSSIGTPICSAPPCGVSLSQGASVLFTVDSGTLSNGSHGNSTKQIAKTNAAGIATVTLTVPSSSGAVVHVTAEGPYGLGHPVATFAETAQ
ncbi:MAG TPA: glycoside hydrolase family 44 protein [Terriglobales bacterium]